MYKTLNLTNEGNVWTITINRPEALNALNSQVVTELNEAFHAIAHKRYTECRALIITGAGEKAFVAGADIKELQGLTESAAMEFAKNGQKLFRQIENLKVPVIAAVNGFALGGGCELALACDFIYASENAKFALPEVTLGVIPGFGGTVRLSRAIGLPRAREITFTGEMLTAQRAFEMGLVNKVMPQAELLATVSKTAQTMAARGPIAIAQAKKSILKTYDLDIDLAMRVEAEQFASLFKSKDAKEGLIAFIEKRKANFLGE